MANARSNKKSSKANERQVGGSHYKDQRIEPWDYITENKIPYLEGNVIKYVSRHAFKGGLQDLEKAQHYLEKIIENVKKADLESK